MQTHDLPRSCLKLSKLSELMLFKRIDSITIVERNVLIEGDWPLYSSDCSTQQCSFLFNDQHRKFYLRLVCSLLSGRFSKLISFPLNCRPVWSQTFWSGNNHVEGFHDWYSNLKVSEWSNHTLSKYEWIRQLYTGSISKSTKQRVMSQFSVSGRVNRKPMNVTYSLRKK